jgi:hypothetical protein
MPHAKHASKRKRMKEALPVLGVVGMSLSLAGGASAATAVPAADVPPWDTSRPQITLSEEEIADVSLATFYVFDKENAGTPWLGERFARGCGRCGGCRCGRGCAVRGGARGCAVGGGARGRCACGGCGCGQAGGGGCGGAGGGGGGCGGGGGGCGGGGCGGGGGCCLTWGACRNC